LSEILATGDCSPAAVDLFQGFVTYDSGRRRLAQETLEHYYFTDEVPPPEPIDRMPVPRYRVTIKKKSLIGIIGIKGNYRNITKW
jgi:hypothetical protein